MSDQAAPSVLLLSFDASDTVLGRATAARLNSKVELRVEPVPGGYHIPFVARGLVGAVGPVMSELEQRYGRPRVTRRDDAKGILEADLAVRRQDLPKTPIIGILVELLEYLTSPVLRFQAGVGAVASEVKSSVDPDWLVRHMERRIKGSKVNLHYQVQALPGWIPKLVSHRSRTSM